jgi:hypothetical protein
MSATATRTSTEEQLVEHVVRLARRTEALDDFAGLVAHDVKSALITALRDEDPREGLTRALELVDSILEAVRADQAGTGVARLAECVQQAIADVGASGVEIVTRLRRARSGFTSLLSRAEIRRFSSSTTTVSGSARLMATPPERNLACDCAVVLSSAAAACSSSGREPSAERAP